MTAYEINPYKRTAGLRIVEGAEVWAAAQGFKHTDYETVTVGGKYFAVLYNPAEAFKPNCLASVYDAEGLPALWGAVLVMALTQPNNEEGELTDVTADDYKLLSEALQFIVTAANTHGHAVLFIEEV